MKKKSIETAALGIDIGSVAISLVRTDLQGNILNVAYKIHYGNPEQVIRKYLEQLDKNLTLAVTCSGNKSLFGSQSLYFNPQVSLMQAVHRMAPGTRSILHVGAEKFFLIALNEKGAYDYTITSSSCAAGTGSFLDQQAKRLHLKNTGELVSLSNSNTGKTPEIASRCAVFAKTDLIHAQQQGFPVAAICDSLCRGLAENIVDSLFNKYDPVAPLLMTGGVALNSSVVRHLENLLGIPVSIHDYSQHMIAIGAILQMLEGPYELLPSHSIDAGSLLQIRSSKHYFYEPLTGTGHRYPDFRSDENILFKPRMVKHVSDILIDVFQLGLQHSGDKEISGTPLRVLMGVDIGSTSTKAILMDLEKKPLAGFYTYTSGYPLRAVQAIFEAVSHFQEKYKVVFKIIGCGTTGSGRKFIGKIVRADRVYDEITAHARAAYELNPKTDTIIEIGGQDAKFTLMKDGVVTFSHMNTVCAAGTGSFIEELAGKMGVSLADYSSRSENVQAPLASDRCTVFMERDINYLLANGYQVDEVLATILHSVRENYLKKVANEAQIGNHICFQGATAKNRALVSAFEQRLGQSIFVSKYCHLTGALGTALLLQEEIKEPTTFRGLDIYRQSIPIFTETCNYCLNHCLISIAKIDGETEAYGFLCGRDYKTKKYVNPGIAQFDLLKARSKIKVNNPIKSATRESVIGIPSALHMHDDLEFWKDFFNELSFPVKTSERYKDSLRTGKRMAGAEFCAPVDAMYGHVAYLKEKVDYIFMPAYLESRRKPSGTERNYCYYTQFSASLAYLQGKGKNSTRFISPLLNFNRKREYILMELYRSLIDTLSEKILFEEVNQAYQKAERYSELRSREYTGLFNKTFDPSGEISVVCLGRPYVVLSEVLNKGIPDIFSRLGINVFYQDMIPLDKDPPDELEKLIHKVPWHFAALILQVAWIVARTPGLYPVFITAFKCAPDSFIIEYFKQIMHLYEKPYLIIQIDEHDLNVGYETRIESAIRSFRNHKTKKRIREYPVLKDLLPFVHYKINGKTLLMPNWDTFISPLIVANLRRSGIDARLLETNELSIRRSMAHNTGQCLPINIITQDYIDYIKVHQLDPEQTVLWMMEGKLTCNIRQYPYYIKKLLNNYGKGFERTSVYSGNISHMEFSLQTTYYAYFAYMLGGLFKKVACRIRPYELKEGTTDKALAECQSILINLFEGRLSIDQAIEACFDLFERISYDNCTRKPLVAVFGDFYVRDNDIMNQNLIRDIEKAGGEVLTTPYHDYVKITIDNVLRRAVLRGEYLETSMNRIMLKILKALDKKYYQPFGKYLGPAAVINPKELEKNLESFNIDRYHSGESVDNILKIFYILKNYPEVSLFVQTNPAYCCPSLITEAMTHKIREITGVPVVTITYDGTTGQMNEVIIPYIKSALSKN
ncbi:MAG: hypothetical protein JXA39_06435 [Bacteroidales bacterium]|nr:hypothetical protein [Bacteroidales bacterium]